MFNNKLPMMARLFVAVCFLSYFTSFIECSPLQKTSSELLATCINCFSSLIVNRLGLETCVSIVKRQQCGMYCSETIT